MKSPASSLRSAVDFSSFVCTAWHASVAACTISLVNTQDHAQPSPAFAKSKQPELLARTLPKAKIVHQNLHFRIVLAVTFGKLAQGPMRLWILHWIHVRQISLLNCKREIIAVADRKVSTMSWQCTTERLCG